MTTSPGRIYLSAQRQFSITKSLRFHSTFSDGLLGLQEARSESAVKILNDEILSGACSTACQSHACSHTILIPITGDLIFKNDDQRISLDVGEMLIRSGQASRDFKVVNRYQDEEINYLRFEVEDSELLNPGIGKFHYDLEVHRNALINITAALDKLPFSVNIGAFAGREETIFRLQDERSVLLAYVIAGAFEIEGRLLEAGDALELWDIREAELEALSNQAIIVLLELVKRTGGS
ncbi:hypothetical protein GZH53_13620 [Flavihumibacter sp. R14]|nr:hypothetical protein [Flavihumibacter soli]